MNSQLFFNERGNIRARDVRPLARSTPARFDLPDEMIERAELFIAAQKHAVSTPALAARIGGTEYSLDVPQAGRVCWLRAPLETSGLRDEMEVPAQDGWSLAHDAAGAPVIRLRAWGEGLNDETVFPIYGDAIIEAQREAWLSLLPPSLQTLDNRWDWCWRLAEWLASSWPYANEFEATSYAPWDARTILEWGRDGRDPHGEKPIVMCVHYAVCFVQFCIAMGVPARAVVLTPDFDSSNGHFVPEVWLEEFGSWAMLDPNLHLCFRDEITQRPLAVAELFVRRDELSTLANFGAGFESQKNRLQEFAQTLCCSGDVYRFWGVWARHDWIKNAVLAPPAHGMVLYAETDILWCDDEATRNELAMFPHFLSAQQMALAPSGCQLQSTAKDREYSLA